MLSFLLWLFALRLSQGHGLFVSLSWKFLDFVDLEMSLELSLVCSDLIEQRIQVSGLFCGDEGRASTITIIVLALRRHASGSK